MATVRKRRVRRERPRLAERQQGWTGFEPSEHHPYTIEGQIEGLGRFARGVSNTRGWKRWAAKAVVLAPVLIIAVMGLVLLVVQVLDALV